MGKGIFIQSIKKCFIKHQLCIRCILGTVKNTKMSETWSLTSRDDLAGETRHVQVKIQSAIKKQNITMNVGYREFVQGEVEVTGVHLFALWPSVPIPTVGKTLPRADEEMCKDSHCSTVASA